MTLRRSCILQKVRGASSIMFFTSLCSNASIGRDWRLCVKLSSTVSVLWPKKVSSTISPILSSTDEVGESWISSEDTVAEIHVSLRTSLSSLKLWQVNKPIRGLQYSTCFYRNKILRLDSYIRYIKKQHYFHTISNL